MQSAIEFAGVSTLEHHGEIFAVHPIGLFAELFPNPLIKFRAWKRIRNRNADVVRLCVTNKLDGLLNLGPRFTRIAELKEKAGANAVPTHVLPRLNNLSNANALLHGIQNLL